MSYSPFRLLLFFSLFLSFCLGTEHHGHQHHPTLERSKIGEYLPLTPSNDIPEITRKTLEEAGTAKDFFYSHVSPSLPVIITGLVGGWNASQHWNETYLTEKIGKKTIKVEVLPEPVFSFFSANQTSMKLSDFLNKTHHHHHHGHRHYFAQTSIKEKIPSIAKDVGELTFAKFLKPTFVDHLLLSLSEGDQVTPLHLETSERFIAQISGSKVITLFHPSQSNLLYPIEKELSQPILSQVNITHPNLEKFPLFANAKSVQVKLNQGEILFVPTFWWYQIESVGSNVAVSFCYEPHSETLINFFVGFSKKIPTQVTSQDRQDYLYYGEENEVDDELDQIINQQFSQ